MSVTEEEVIEYVREHPGCKSKEIASAFGVSSSEVNRANDTGYPGIYRIKAIRSEKFRHYPAEADCIYETETPQEHKKQIFELEKKVSILLETLPQVERLFDMYHEAEQKIAEQQEQIDELTSMVESIKTPKLKVHAKPKPKK